MLNRRHLIQSAVFGLAATAVLGGLLRPAMAKAADGVIIKPELLTRASAAYGKHGASITQRDIIAIADFSAASHDRRFHLFNVHNGQTASLLVAHGKGSDPEHSGWLQSFSNIPGSEASSAGSYIIGESYFGQHGQSLRLQGLDPENDQAESRAIVIHPAWYVSDAMIQDHGKLGRSQGCFAVSEGDIAQVLERLGTGSFLFADKV